jgi:hypothetical protein
VKLRDVVDLEVQLALDDAEDQAALRARDRALYLELAAPPNPPPASASALLSAWLEALRTRFGEPRVGERVAVAQRILAYGLALGGLMSGWGVAELLLQFEQGGAPVNVGYYLFVMVFGQLGMLLILALGMLLRRLWPQLPLVGDLARVLRYVLGRLQRHLRERHAVAGQRVEAEFATYRAIQTRLGLYREVERYLLLSHTQLFAVAFNLGALASCLRLILLSDLAFAWSTSVTSLDAAQVERLCQLLASPFAWLVPDAVPSRELIVHTQYYRLEGRFAEAAAGTRGNAALAGEWWRFLVACTVTYGLLPRLFAHGLFWAKFRRAEREVPLDTPAVQRVLARLTTPALSTRAPDLVAQAAEPARPERPLQVSAQAATALVVYRDIPTDVALVQRAIAQNLALEVTSVHHAGGFAAHRDEALTASLGAASGSVSVLAEAWEAPDKSLRNFLAALRNALGPRRALRVLLIGEAHEHGYRAPAPEDVRVYRDRLTLLEDPYLSVEALPASEATAPFEQETRQ